MLPNISNIHEYPDTQSNNNHGCIQMTPKTSKQFTSKQNSHTQIHEQKQKQKQKKDSFFNETKSLRLVRKNIQKLPNHPITQNSIQVKKYNQTEQKAT